MSWALFLDESGNDRRESPYEVLAGIAVQDTQIWPLIRQISDAQQYFFGMRLFEAYGSEAKAKRLLKRKVFRQAVQLPPFGHHERTALALSVLEDGTTATQASLTALAQAKLAYVGRVIEICEQFGAKAFATFVPRESERPESDALRKDYAFLFERFYHHLSRFENEMGYLVFDELERSQSHILLTQVSAYFLRTKNGRERASRIIPEPFFVHSDLTALIQVADFVCYLAAWGIRLKGMNEPVRDELQPFVAALMRLRYQFVPDGGPTVYGFKYVRDLRPRMRSA